MESYYPKFVDNLREFVTELDTTDPNNQNIKAFLKIFHTLGMSKVMERYIKIMWPHVKKGYFENRDDRMFDQPINVVPKVDISVIMKSGLSDIKRNRFWTYMQLLYVYAELVIQSSDPTKRSEQKTQRISAIMHNMNTYDKSGTLIQSTESPNSIPDPQTSETKEFNPFEGVGTSDGSFGIGEMFGGPEKLPPEGGENSEGGGILDKIGGIGQISNMLNGAGGIGNIAEMMTNLKSPDGMKNLSKMINLDFINDQLKSLSKEEIDEANNELKKMLGEEFAASEGGSMLTAMLENIGNEVSNADLSEGNPLESVGKIVTNLREKMKPQMESGNIDMAKMSKTLMTSVMKNLGDDGIDLGMEDGEDFNPMAMMGKLFGNISSGGGDSDSEGGEGGGFDPMKMMGQMFGQMQSQMANMNNGENNDNPDHKDKEIEIENGGGNDDNFDMMKSIGQMFGQLSKDVENCENNSDENVDLGSIGNMLCNMMSQMGGEGGENPLASLKNMMDKLNEQMDQNNDNE
jgi:hypothetical protein